ncbi:MAG: sulfatase-like hydrolase/transferase [Clostridiales bacterium]|nr:sulfatase-like hydrolase/transferase [Clostridiales bacterium]
MIKFTKRRLSFTRNKLRWGIVIAAMLVMLLVVLFASSVFESKETVTYLGRRSQPAGVLNGEEPLVQPFVPEKRHVDYIEIRFASNVEEGNVVAPEGILVFQVTEEDGDLLYAENVPIMDIKDNEYIRFKLDQTLELEKTYLILMKTVGTKGEEVPTVWVSTNVRDALRDVSYPGVSSSIRMQCNAQFRYSEMDYPAMIISIFLVLICGLLAVTHVDLSDKENEYLFVTVMCLMPVLMFTITELLNNNSLLLKSVAAYLVNYALYLFLYLVLFIAFNRFRLTTIIVNAVIFAIAIFNYFKFLWRGEPVQLLDVVTLQTAMNVSDNYHIELSPILIISALLFILSIIIVTKIRFALSRKRSRAYLGILASVLGIFLLLVLVDSRRNSNSMLDMMRELGFVRNENNQPSNYMKNGMVVALTMNAQHVSVQIPEGYSQESVQHIQEIIKSTQEEYSILPSHVMTKYELDKSTHEQEGKRVLKEGEKPNIICIMDESYSDMSSVGHFETNLELHPYMDALFQGDNVIHGDLFVSVYGGGTANSEFEFLTGNSMAFFPNGSIPYQQYIESDTGSLARFLKGKGYQTIAVHPYLASGWNRPDVYEKLAFDQFLSIDDFNENAGYIRSYISDKSSFDKLIELYENKEEGQPLFLFNVTMQNHGQYTSTNPNFNQDVQLVDYPGKFPETEQYLSLARQTDIAVQDLVDYFYSVDEPVIICFFGDHLPSMKNGFYETMMDKETFDMTAEEMQNLYKTDFFIWANYDIPEYEIKNISLNYLSTLLLQMTGLDLPEYNLLIAETYNQYPVLTTMGVYDKAGNRYNSMEDVPDATGLLNEYNILAYNNVFETTARRAEIFDIVDYVPWKKETEES